jgi:hypothetical protein
MRDAWNLLWKPRFPEHVVMRRSEDGGNGGYVDGLVSLETGCGVSRLEGLDR